MRSLSTHCQFEELVVLWIAASLYPRFHVYPLRLARQRRKKGSHLFLIPIVAELLPPQDVIYLGPRSQRLSSACIFRFCSGAAESYARAVCGSSGIVIVAFAMALTFLHTTANILCPLHLRSRPVRLVL